MCGIAGLWSPAAPAEGLDREVEAMARTLAHRGPDDSGVWVDEAAGLGLGHRRLSIIDLSPGGHQPMCSACGRWVVAFNGEIYNFRELRARLNASVGAFRSRSDTEVLLAAIATWGVEEALRRSVGMFALAVWDRRDRELWLARDRLGIKPLYYGWAGRRLAFASELKAIAAAPGFERRIDRRAMTGFFRFGYLPSPTTVYQDVHAVRPGHLVRVGRRALETRRLDPVTWWSPLDHVRRERRAVTPDEAAEEVEAQLRDAVQLRLIADVPLGAFLSGGIDSSLVVAVMRQLAGGGVRTFTVGFDDPTYDESRHARAVAGFLGTDHTEVRLTERDALEVVPSIPEIWDEPFADPSQIPTLLVSRVARQHVTVALSGDGGDELFGGYTRYDDIARDWNRRSRMPPAVRQVLRRGGEWAAASRRGRRLLPLAAALRLAGKSIDDIPTRLRWRLAGLGAEGPVAFYRGHAACAMNPQLEGFLVEDRARPLPADAVAASAVDGIVETMMLHDVLQYLPDDILTKVDRASMAVSLEARVPLLDHRLVELAWRLPVAVKREGGVGKAVLRRVLGRHLPAELYERPKMGFGMPFGEWLRGPLQDWAEELLQPTRLAESGLFHEGRIREAWRAHLADAADHRNLLWPVLIFESWRRRWRAT